MSNESSIGDLIRISKYMQKHSMHMDKLVVHGNCHIAEELSALTSSYHAKIVKALERGASTKCTARDVAGLTNDCYLRGASPCVPVVLAALRMGTFLPFGLNDSHGHAMMVVNHQIEQAVCTLQALKQKVNRAPVDELSDELGKPYTPTSNLIH